MRFIKVFLSLCGHQVITDYTLVNLWDELLSQVACYVILVCRPLAWKYYELTVMENFPDNFTRWHSLIHLVSYPLLYNQIYTYINSFFFHKYLPSKSDWFVSLRVLLVSSLVISYHLVYSMFSSCISSHKISKLFTHLLTLFLFSDTAMKYYSFSFL